MANYECSEDRTRVRGVELFNFFSMLKKQAIIYIEFSNIINSDFKNNEDLEWLNKITKNQTKKNEILEFKKFVDKLASVK